MKNIELFQLSADLIPCRRTYVDRKILFSDMMSCVVVSAENMGDLIASVKKSLCLDMVGKRIVSVHMFRVAE